MALKRKMKYKLRSLFAVGLATAMMVFTSCQKPDKDIVLKGITDVVADANDDPTLKANAVFYNPNNVGGRLKNIDIEITVNGKKAGTVKQDYKLKIPAKGEFSVPFAVKLNMKELGTLSTLLGFLGGKKFDVHYKGNLKLTYRGIPVKVPVDHKDQIRVSF